MSEISFGTLITVLQEMFGFWVFWILCVGAILVTCTYLYVLVRDRAVSWRKFVLAQLSMPFGAAAAVWFVLRITASRIGDLGGAVDVIVLLLVAMAGAFGAAILVYTVQALAIGRPGDEERLKV